jgi:peptidoglycan L-alanyl-D-glutamate endopeptidase CwlK
MPEFSAKSKMRLKECDTRLQDVANAAIHRIDFTILCGHRGKEDQEDAFERGTTRLHYPKSKHNKFPSMAFDAAPYPINWDDIDRFKAMATIILDEARKLHIPIRWGGDFNRNGLPDDKFKDLPHFEIDE